MEEAARVAGGERIEFNKEAYVTRTAVLDVTVECWSELSVALF